jgi:SAM-dependent methyltransferase
VSAFVIYQDPLTYLLGLEGIALHDAWAGDHDRAFTETRLAEIRQLLDDEKLRDRGVLAERVSTVTAYEQHSASYDAEAGGGLFATDEPVVAEYLSGRKPGVALDAACGTGRFAEFLAKRGHQVIGVDSSPDMLAHARQRVTAGEFHVAELDRPPLADDSADVIVCALALEAVEHVITQAGALRADPGADDDPLVLGSVWFELPAADVTGSDDARLYGSLMRGEHSKPGLFGSTQYPWDWLDDLARERLSAADLNEAISILAGALASTGDAGDSEDCQLLARSVFEPGAVWLSADRTSVSLNVDGAALPVEARRAAARIAAQAGEDRLWKLAQDLASEGWAHVAWAASGFFDWKDFAASFPPVIVLDGDIESLSAELERRLASVHNVLWANPLKVMSSNLLVSTFQSMPPTATR